MVSKRRFPRHWICPRCPKGVTVFADLPEPPVHLCHPRGDKVYGLELEVVEDEES